jgi:hypothetical protein
LDNDSIRPPNIPSDYVAYAAGEPGNLFDIGHLYHGELQYLDPAIVDYRRLDDVDPWTGGSQFILITQ